MTRRNEKDKKIICEDQDEDGTRARKRVWGEGRQREDGRGGEFQI